MIAPVQPETSHQPEAPKDKPEQTILVYDRDNVARMVNNLARSLAKDKTALENGTLTGEAKEKFEDYTKRLGPDVMNKLVAKSERDPKQYAPNKDGIQEILIDMGVSGDKYTLDDYKFIVYQDRSNTRAFTGWGDNEDQTVLRQRMRLSDEVEIGSPEFVKELFTGTYKNMPAVIEISKPKEGDDKNPPEATEHTKGFLGERGEGDIKGTRIKLRPDTDIRLERQVTTLAKLEQAVDQMGEIEIANNAGRWSGTPRLSGPKTV